MRHRLAVTVAIAVAACGAHSNASTAAESQSQWPFEATPIAKLDEPWAMVFLPDGRLLITEKKGRLLVLAQEGEQPQEIGGVPEVAYGGQGGLGDVVLHPRYADNRIVYLSFAEAGENGVQGAAVVRARLSLTSGGGQLTDQEVIWRQEPKVSGRGHYSHRIAFADDGHLFISSGDRQKFTPAQDMQQNLGKIVRLNDDGSVPSENPFAEQGGVSAQIWTLGHRNLLGMTFDRRGRLWAHEMGPRHGDELNLIVPGKNYGWPEVSNGNHYDGRAIPEHGTNPAFEAPKAFWVPAVSPAGLIFYSGDMFPKWKGNAFLGGLSSRSLIRVEIDGDRANEAERFDMGQRIREVEQGPDGAIWLLEDGREENGGRLLKLTPSVSR